MEADHVRRGKKLFQGHRRGPVLQGAGGQVRPIGQHLHAEGPGDARRRPADAPVAHHAEDKACQFPLGGVPIAEIRLLAPLAVVHAPAVIPHPVAQLQQQGKGELGHRLGAVVRHVAHRDAPCRRSGGVHHIVAGGQHPDVAQVRAGGQRGGGDGGLVHQHRPGPRHAGQDELGRGAVVILELAQRLKALPAQVPRVEGMAVHHHYFHLRFIPFAAFFSL